MHKKVNYEVVDYEKDYKELKKDGDSILDRVFKESIDDEGKNWRESFNSRLSSSYDPKEGGE